MAPKRVTKAKATKKKDVGKSATKPGKLASEASREILEERLEFVITCLKETGIKVILSLIHHLISSANITIVSQVDMAAVARHYGISNNAAKLRLRRANDCVAKMVGAREAARKGDETQSDDEPQEDDEPREDDEDLETTEDEEA